MYIINAMFSMMHNELNALGHEIHIARVILLDMFNKKYVGSNDTIVTLCDDRKFLYTKNI